MVTLHGPRLLQLRLALCGDGDVFFSFHIVIQMGLMLDSNAAAGSNVMFHFIILTHCKIFFHL